MISSSNDSDGAIKLGRNSQLNIGDGQNANVVEISAKSDTAINVTEATSGITFKKSTVFSDGSVASKGTVTLSETEFNLKAGSTFTAASVAGSGSSIVINEVVDNGMTASIENNKSADLMIVGSPEFNDRYGSAAEAASALIDGTNVKNAAGGSYSFTGQSGALSDAWTADANGQITSHKANESMEALENFDAMTLVQWRTEGNHINQRLGDVRDLSTTVGAWARIYGYDSSYNDGISIDYKANSIQVGGDYRLNDTWLVGGALSYTDGKGTFSNGSSESDGYTLAAYLSGFFPCGGYVDFVGRIGRLSTDITASSQGSVFKGGYDNTTLGLSAEVGYHWKLNDAFYVEPQAELTYGVVLGDDFTGANDVKISQDDFESLVGRLGARVGASFAEGAGTVYAHASVNHDFLGDSDYTATYGKTTRHFGSDIGGTWVSYGVGAQFNTSANLNFYGVLERSNGSEYQEDYRYSVGMSCRF